MAKIHMTSGFNSNPIKIQIRRSLLQTSAINPQQMILTQRRLPAHFRSAKKKIYPNHKR